MKKLGGLLGSLLLALLPLAVRAEPPVPSAPPAAAPSPYACTEGQYCDPSCNLYSLYVMTGVKFPFELYARSGASFLVSSTPLDRAIKTGMALEVGARTFCFDADHGAAWVADVGFDYFYNRADPAKVVVIRTPNLEVTQGSGVFSQSFLTPARDELGAYQLHRMMARLGGGREWYFLLDDPGVRCSLGVDAGFRLGAASAKTRLIRRFLLDPTFEVDDNVTFGPTDDGRVSDILKGYYMGGALNLMIPRCGYDFIIGVRAEYSHDFIRFPGFFNTDDALDQVQTLVTFGIRY